MNLRRKTPQRLNGVVLAALAVLLVAASFGSNGDHVQIPGAVLASGSDFTLSGTASNLAPGVSSTLVLTVDNPQTVPLTVTQVTVTVSPDPAGCSALTNLTVNNTAFTGNPPAVTVTGSPLPQSVPGKTGATDGTATISLPILVARNAGNGCQSITFPFTYSGKATFTAATTTTLTSSPNPSSFGQPATFTATVAASPSSTNPAVGNVTFYRCTNPANLAAGSPASACTSAVALGPPQAVNGSGQASLTISTLPVGSSAIYAVFTPTDATNYASSTSTTITQTVGFSQPCITTSVNGGYTVASGQSICIASPARVNGGVTVQANGSLYLNGVTVNGGLSASNAGALLVCGTTVNGGISISGSTGFVTLGDGGDDGAPSCAGNTVHGGVTVTTTTGSFEVAGNSITGTATFSSNTGTGPYWQDATPEIEGNQITGGLSCTSNNPAPSNGGQANSVSGQRSGQCSAGSF
jgi:hypothetical protein